MYQSWTTGNRILSIISGWLLGLVMMLMVIDVCARVFFNSPILGIPDIVTVFLPVLIFIPLAHTEILGEHIRVEMLTSTFSYKWQTVCEVLATVIGLIVMGIFAWQGWSVALDSISRLEYYPGLLRAPVYPAKTAIALGFTLMWIQLLINCLRALSRLLKKLELGP